MKMTQLNERLKGKIIKRAGTQTLELCIAGYVVTDGWLTDFIIINPHNGEWVQDGALCINKPLKRKLDSIAFNEYKTNK